MRRFRSLGLRGLVLATFGVTFTAITPAPRAEACVDPPPPPPVWVEYVTPTQAWICIHDYHTFGAMPGQFCVCALNQVGPIIEVKELRIVDKLTGAPIAGWNFQPNSNTSAGFGKVAPGDWAGFLGPVTDLIPQGIPVNLKFLVNLAPSTPQDLLGALLSAPVLVGSDEGDPAGNLTGGHLGIVNASDVGAMPPNDDCFLRIPIGDGSHTFNNIGAVLDGPLPSCSDAMDADVWFNYIAQSSGTLRVDTCGSQLDTVLAVYDGCFCPVDAATELGCDDDTCGLQSQVEVPVVAGGCYKIQVGGWQGQEGFGVLNTICLAAPPNDLCGDRIVLPGDGVFTFDNNGANTDGLPLPCPMGSDVWFNYFAQTDGTLNITTCGSGFDTVLAVYDVCACLPDPVFLLECNDDSDCDNDGINELQSTVSVPVVAGGCYKIQVGGFQGAQGTGILDVQCVPAGVVHPVSDHVWSNFHVQWGQGDWTVDGVVVCTTFPGGIRTGAPGDPTHAWHFIDCPDWPNDWHWDAQFQWGPFDVSVLVWFENFAAGDDLSVWIHCWTQQPNYTLIVDTVNDVYQIPEAGFTGAWSEYPDNLPPDFEPTPSFRTNNEGVGDPDLVRAQEKLQDTIVQLQDTRQQLEGAIGQVQNAQFLNDQCGMCADAADAELQRAEQKLQDTIQQIDETIFQLEESLFLVEDAKFLLEVGGPQEQVVSILNQVIMNLQRANQKLERAIQKLEEVIGQLILAEQLLADCGTCADQAMQEIQRAIAKVDRGIQKLERAIEKLDEVYVQVKRVRDRLACPADTNGDRAVDVNDLNNVILDWGTNGMANGGDITGALPGSPPDGTVDVNDLNAIIIGWGPCPQPEG